MTHDKELPPIEGSRRFICSYAHSLENIRSRTPEQIIKGKHIPGVALTVPPATNTVKEVWNRPPVGELKLNVDGAFAAQTGRASAGMILRRDDTSTVFSACKVLHFCASALEAELQACLGGLRFALDMTEERFSVETDSAILVQLMSSKERDSSALGHLVEDLRLLLSSPQVVSFSKIPRLCNKASHDLARFGMENHRTQVWVGSVPESLRDSIREDCNSTLII